VAVVEDIDEAIGVSDSIAPEHLEVHVEPALLEHCRLGLRNYGSLFLGEQATVAYGDKAIGTNHVLPTGRAARYTGGLWVGRFLKTLTYQRVLSDEGTRTVGPPTVEICDAELMWGHGDSVRRRLDRLGGEQP
jgi:sulfopropanediol 3-dehydrogenase